MRSREAPPLDALIDCIAVARKAGVDELATLDDATALAEAHEVWQLLSLAEYLALVG
ncbi:hypothetical protein ACVH9Z_39390 [Rhodococcus opacus]|uniref:Uncharacterized protein n=1 Tax=Rhodococcus opacus TaxID=37919 RepID=A0AAX3YLY5_RHOOP|nr:MULTISPECIES: hypothetical protein [Rhodococcus]NHU46565.1 hypothetical protein [Rhodococcus sp. A14]MBA8960568.1 hypothetical protein [Rhodococcus opacus]MBP2206133.1 hypothetical protein [Rhodococcus opacus]MCZ4587145.1 hypothetical protein [Rhodococcus opacus]MDI9939429.1 hypothetical protein [Rhodococcus sp. IEGM 1351]